MVVVPRTQTNMLDDHPTRPVAGEPPVQARAAGAEARTEKVSVSLPAELTADVRTRVGSRGFSGYVARAVRRQLERDNLDALIAEMELANGPVTEDLLAAVEALWPRADGRSQK